MCIRVLCGRKGVKSTSRRSRWREGASGLRCATPCELEVMRAVTPGSMRVVVLDCARCGEHTKGLDLLPILLELYRWSLKYDPHVGFDVLRTGYLP